MKNEFAYSESEIEGTSPGESLALWIGVLGGPVLWLVQLQTLYMLVPWVCTSGKHWALYLASSVFFILAGAPLVVAWRCRQTVDPEFRDSVGSGRRIFMANLGVLVSGLFLLVILAQAIPSFFLNPCQD